MKNKVTDLNNLLFEQMERLRDSNEKSLSSEIKRSDAMVDISKQIIETQSMALVAAKLKMDYCHKLEKDVLPEAFIAHDVVPRIGQQKKVVQ